MTKKIKKFIFFTIILIIIILFSYLKLKTYTYKTSYVLNSFKIEEKFNKDVSEYTFLINYKDTIYPYSFKNKYIRKKELINDIKIYTNDAEICLLPTSDYLNFYPICQKDTTLTLYNLSNIEINDYKYQDITTPDIKHNKISINYLNNQNYLLYNYKGFYFIKENEIKNIELFSKDNYTLNLLYEIDKYLIIPDYNKDYYFNKLYIINKETGKLKTIEFDYEISFNSIFLGDYKNNIYLLDKKEKQEYKISIKKFTITKSDYLILKNGKLEKTTYKNIVNNNLVFDNKETINYELIDNKLYQVIEEYKILITNYEVDKIIKEEDNTIYYLVKDNLYMYNNTYGEVLLINNFEWNFNNTNMIYLYK